MLFVGEPPPLLPFTFLSGGADDNYLRVSLDSLLSDTTLKRLAAIHVVGGDPTEAESPGGKLFGFDSTYRIRFGGKPSYLPTSISRVLSNGVTVGETDIAYQPVECGNSEIYLPQSVTMTSHDEKNEEGPSENLTVTSLELDKSIPREIFTMDYQRARTIIDMDALETQAQRAKGDNSGDANGSVKTLDHGSKSVTEVDIPSQSVVNPASPVFSASSPANAIGGIWIGIACVSGVLVIMICYLINKYRLHVVLRDER
jgi:hypothetical protein